MARPEPDRAALEAAHRALRTTLRLEDMLMVPAHAIVLNILARRHMQRRARVDLKKLQANDNE